MPTLVGLGFAGVFGPTRGRVAGVGYSLPLVCGGTPPTTPAMGASPPWTPLLPNPVGFGFAGVLGPTRGGVANVGNSFPLLSLRGTPPTTPCHGGFAPLDPRLPTPVGFGFASVLGPTRGGVANVGNSFPLLSLWGTPPQPPAMGASPPWTPACPPSLTLD